MCKPTLTAPVTLTHPAETHTIVIDGTVYYSVYRCRVQVRREMTARQIRELLRALKRDGWVAA